MSFSSVLLFALRSVYPPKWSELAERRNRGIITHMSGDFLVCYWLIRPSFSASLARSASVDSLMHALRVYIFIRIINFYTVYSLKPRGCNNNINLPGHSYFMNDSTNLRVGHHAVSKFWPRVSPEIRFQSVYVAHMVWWFLEFTIAGIFSAYEGILLIYVNSRSSIELLANNSLRIVSDWGFGNRLSA
jgi:hypothetical protein